MEIMKKNSPISVSAMAPLNELVPASPRPANLTAFRTNPSLERFLRIMRTLSTYSPGLAAQVSTFLFLRPRRKALTYMNELPAGGRKIHILHAQRRLVGYEWGSGRRKVLLVHGWESHLGHMLPLVQPLVAAGFKVIAMDGPGHGQSPGHLTHIIDYGDAVGQALRQFGPFTAVIASSFGAAATSLLLSREPQLKVQGLIMLSPMKHIWQHIQIFEKILGYPPAMHERILANIARRVAVPLEDCDVARAVGRFPFPALIVHDQEDAVIPAAGSREIAAAYPGSVLRITQGLGHRGLVSDRQVQRWILDFLLRTMR